MSGIGAARHGISVRYAGVCATCGAGYRLGEEIQAYLLGALEELIGLLEHMGVDIGAEEG